MFLSNLQAEQGVGTNPSAGGCLREMQNKAVRRGILSCSSSSEAISWWLEYNWAIGTSGSARPEGH